MLPRKNVAKEKTPSVHTKRSQGDNSPEIAPTQATMAVIKSSTPALERQLGFEPRATKIL